MKNLIKKILNEDTENRLTKKLIFSREKPISYYWDLLKHVLHEEGIFWKGGKSVLRDNNYALNKSHMLVVDGDNNLAYFVLNYDELPGVIKMLPDYETIFVEDIVFGESDFDRLFSEGKNKKTKESTGIFIIAKDTNNFLLLHRVNKPVVWSLLSGSMDKKGEQPKDTIIREIGEELGEDPSFVTDIKQLGTFKTKKTIFHLFVGFCETERDFPNLDHSENDDYGWFNETNLPTPIHHRWEQSFHLLKHFLHLRENIKSIINKVLYE